MTENQHQKRMAELDRKMRIQVNISRVVMYLMIALLIVTVVIAIWTKGM